MIDVSYNLDYYFNMFGLSGCLQSGMKMTGGKSFIKAISPDGKQEILFNIVIQTPQGAIYANMMRQDIETANAGVDHNRCVRMTMSKAHSKLGHSDIEKAQCTAID